MGVNGSFIPDATTPIAISPMVDIERAEAAEPYQLEVILASSAEVPEQLNCRVRSLIAGANLCRELPQ
eukprot:1183425-Prymnesium_polylepis.1